MINNKGEHLISTHELGFRTIKQEDIFGGSTIEEAAKIFMNVLENKGTEAQKNVVLANAAQAIQCFELDKSISECTALANESLVSGKAHQTLKKIIVQ